MKYAGLKKDQIYDLDAELDRDNGELLRYLYLKTQRDIIKKKLGGILMKKRFLALLMVCVMLFGILAGCGNNGPITAEKAQSIALDYIGLKEKDVSDVHTHVTDDNGIPCYSIHITTADDEFSVIINASTGEVID